MRAISINDVIEARKALEEQGLSCRLHLHDACGRQTLSLELPADAPAHTLERAQTLLADFFAARAVTIEFSRADGTVFYAV